MATAALPPRTRTPAQQNARAVRHLKRVDPRLGTWIARVGPCPLAPVSGGTHFDYLSRCIVYQQLSGKAAGTIHGRYVQLFPADVHRPAHLLTLADEMLRGVGLSRGKMASLRDLARRTHEGALPLDAIERLDDDAAIEALSSVRGIGRWTAQMFLMFRLGRPDLLADLDLGVQKGVQKVYGLRKLPKPERVQEIGKVWAPYRTVATWYMWRVLELDD